MVRKSLSKVPKPFNAEKYLRMIGLGKETYPMWKFFGKKILQGTAIGLAGWWYNETSPLGWFNLKVIPKEEKELAHLYERTKFPYPGDEEAMNEFIANGGMIGTTIGPKGFFESDNESVNIHKALQNRMMDQEAMKLWVRMRNEVVSELQEKGFHVE